MSDLTDKTKFGLTPERHTSRPVCLLPPVTLAAAALALHVTVQGTRSGVRTNRTRAVATRQTNGASDCGQWFRLRCSGGKCGSHPARLCLHDWSQTAASGKSARAVRTRLLAPVREPQTRQKVGHWRRVGMKDQPTLRFSLRSEAGRRLCFPSQPPKSSYIQSRPSAVSRWRVNPRHRVPAVSSHFRPTARFIDI